MFRTALTPPQWSFASVGQNGSLEVGRNEEVRLLSKRRDFGSEGADAPGLLGAQEAAEYANHLQAELARQQATVAFVDEHTISVDFEAQGDCFRFTGMELHAQQADQGGVGCGPYLEPSSRLAFSIAWRADVSGTARNSASTAFGIHTSRNCS